MSSFHEFSFAEQRQIRELIASTWATVEPGMAGPAAVIPYRPTIPIGTFFEDFVLPEPGAVDRQRADRLCRNIVRYLGRRGVMLIGPQHLEERLYYRWLIEDFFLRQIPVGTAPHRPARFRFTELAPASVDAVFEPVRQLTRRLLRLEEPPSARLLARPDRHLRYLSAWQQSHRDARLDELYPLRLHDCIDGSGTVLRFHLSYQAALETGRLQPVAGEGSALLSRRGGQWRIVSLAFPGLELPGDEPPPAFF